jgi:hypothetical protein
LLCLEIAPVFGGEALQRAHDRGQDRQVRQRTFLNIEDSDFNRRTVEARDGAARV